MKNKILCECGCGTFIDFIDKYRGTKRRFAHGHNRRWTIPHNYKNGRSMRKGYNIIHMPEHPRANSNGYVLEHILTAEKILGRSLPAEVEIHHSNGRGDNSCIVICQDCAYHRLLHQRERAYKNCGHANWLKCTYCHQYDDPKNLYVFENQGRHKECKSKYGKQWYKNKSNKSEFDVKEISELSNLL